MSDLGPDAATKSEMKGGARPTSYDRSTSVAKFSEIYRLHLRSIQAYCTRRLDSSRVPDAVSEIFLIAWRRLDDVPEAASALPWLYGTAFRVVSNEWRSRARNRRLLDRLAGLGGDDLDPPEFVILRRDEHRMVLRAAARLRPADQEILRLSLWEGLSHAEVAEVIGAEESVIKQRAYRARSRLAQEYDKVSGERKSPAARKDVTDVK